MVWNDTRQEGNPTCSAQLARLTMHMQIFQIQRYGVTSTSNVRRPLTPQEFEFIQEANWKIPNRELGLCGSALNFFQLQMVGRPDDSAKFREADLKAYTMYPEFGVWARLPWSRMWLRKEMLLQKFYWSQWTQGMTASPTLGCVLSIDLSR